jgi:amino acid permease
MAIDWTTPERRVAIGMFIAIIVCVIIYFFLVTSIFPERKEDMIQMRPDSNGLAQ